MFQLCVVWLCLLNLKDTGEGRKGPWNLLWGRWRGRSLPSVCASHPSIPLSLVRAHLSSLRGAWSWAQNSTHCPVADLLGSGHDPARAGVWRRQLFLGTDSVFLSAGAAPGPNTVLMSSSCLLVCLPWGRGAGSLGLSLRLSLQGGWLRTRLPLRGLTHTVKVLSSQSAA